MVRQPSENKKVFHVAEFLLLLGIIIFLNIIFFNHFFRIDLTHDKLFSISPTSKQLVGNINEKMFVEVYLEGDLTPDYQRLSRSIKEKLQELRVYSNNNLEYSFVNPNAIPDKRRREQYFAQLMQKGILYKYERKEINGKVEENILFPAALIHYKGKETAVNFLKGSKILSIEQQLNQAVEGIEFELVASMRKLNSNFSKSIAFLEGHGEYSKEQVADISSALSEVYNVQRVSFTDSSIFSEYQVLVIADPANKFSDKQLHLLNRFVMEGRSLLICLDPVNLNVDSLANGYTFAFPSTTGLNELLFKFGVRLNTDLIQDLNCGLIQVQTGQAGQNDIVSWPFFPILYHYASHAIVKNLDALSSKYISSIDTVKATGITKIPLIFTTQNTKVISTPARVDLNDARKDQNKSSYNSGTRAIAYLLEGKFQNAYKNRNFTFAGSDTIVSRGGKIVICSDADLIKNEIGKQNGQPVPLGYDPNIKYEFSNKSFFLNCIDYLMNEELINIRNKEIALRPLDKIKLTTEQSLWQSINLIVPVVCIMIFGIVRHYLRKRRYEFNG